jgi:hypothetical protein
VFIVKKYCHITTVLFFSVVILQYTGVGGVYDTKKFIRIKLRRVGWIKIKVIFSVLGVILFFGSGIVNAAVIIVDPADQQGWFAMDGNTGTGGLPRMAIQGQVV